jgi:Zn finger protein HypA/HybF involved in hydrogenase expression
MPKLTSRAKYLAQNRLKSELKETAPEAKIRTCLKCSGEFKSTGPGNRLCPKCQATNKSVRHTRPISPVRGSRTKGKSVEGQ